MTGYTKRDNTINGFGLIGILIVIAVIALVGGGGLYLRETQNQKTIQQIGIEKLKEAEALRQKIEQQDEQAQEVLKENLQSATNTIDTSDWKTYRNEKYGFVFKYPSKLPEWKVKIGEVTSQPFGLKTDIYLSSGTLGITIILNAPGIGLEGAPWEIMEDEGKVVGDAYFQKKIIKDQEKDVYWIQMNVSPYATTGVTSSLTTSYLIISDEVNKKDLLDNYNQILSTFKLIP